MEHGNIFREGSTSQRGGMQQTHLLRPLVLREGIQHFVQQLRGRLDFVWRKGRV